MFCSKKDEESDLDGTIDNPKKPKLGDFDMQILVNIELVIYKPPLGTFGAQDLM